MFVHVMFQALSEVTHRIWAQLPVDGGEGPAPPPSQLGHHGLQQVCLLTPVCRWLTGTGFPSQALFMATLVPPILSHQTRNPTSWSIIPCPKRLLGLS